MRLKEEERSLLEKIDRILRSEKVRAQICPIVERVRVDLAAKTDAVMTWEPISLSIFGDALPPEIRSNWVFILRAGANTGAERHPNSHQRMMGFEGTGDMQTEEAKQTPNIQRSTSNVQLTAGKANPTGKWQSNILVSDSDAPLERRWISIPQNVWHQPVVPRRADWAVVSFHTVPAEELIEERPDSDGTKQMVYLSKK